MNVIEAGTKCCERVRGANLGWRYEYKQCSRLATVEREGKFYCKQHDPEARDAKRAASHARFEANLKAQADRRNFVTACEQAIRHIADGYNDPVGLACEVLAKEFGE